MILVVCVRVFTNTPVRQIIYNYGYIKLWRQKRSKLNNKPIKTFTTTNEHEQEVENSINLVQYFSNSSDGNYLKVKHYNYFI